MEQRVVRIGNSVGVVIPQTLRDQVGLKPGDKVMVEKDPVEKVLLVYPQNKLNRRSAITPEFLSWLEDFNKYYSKALKELALR